MNPRNLAIQSIIKADAVVRKSHKERHPFDFFGEHVFNERIQRERLSENIFRILQRTVKMGEELDPEIADAVAEAMKTWALEKGATHFCHWFQPLTDLTAEKHDSMFIPAEEGNAMAEFNGNMLIQGEPDASSFPSGGLRTTFEARGYTAWDPSSPAFLLGRTLVIPTIFLSWAGDALDKKTPLLRSMEVLNEQALRVLMLFGDKESRRIIPTVGTEQEYFLIDKHFLYLRPDLLCCGRTLFGAKPSKGQELEDQYLGSIPERVLAMMEEAEFELMRLGVPIKTRHNEVAPSQYELANTFEPANIAVDHQMLVMDILRRVAGRHGMDCLLHEKPFAGINGSGKHNNWSMATDKGKNLLEPGETPHENAQFLVFCAAVVRAVHKYSSLLRMSVATAGNDHRLGQHEAPPGIISVFLGEQLFDIFHRLATGDGKKENQTKQPLRLGLSLLPPIPCHSSDRNRTSPFAFTGNKFEFRAVGSGENIARANAVLNTIVAESLDYFASELENTQGNFNENLQKLLAETARAFQPILFEGDNYSPEWHEEAEKRGLPNIANTVDAALQYTTDQTVSLFTKYKIFSLRELTSRQEIMLSKYTKKISIEGKTASNIAHTMIIPSVLAYLNELGGAMNYLPSRQRDLLKQIVKHFDLLQKSLKELDDILNKQPLEGIQERAVYMRDQVFPACQDLRSHVDFLEERIADQYWPLPKYREMLFIK
jgi:glutamine synthetase